MSVKLRSLWGGVLIQLVIYLGVNESGFATHLHGRRGYLVEMLGVWSQLLSTERMISNHSAVVVK